jgi:hypothetical protein
MVLFGNKRENGIDGRTSLARYGNRQKSQLDWWSATSTGFGSIVDSKTPQHNEQD